MPALQVSSDESERLIKMEETLHQRVIGQEEAVVAISRAIRRARVGLKNPNRPIASFIFSGPTGDLRRAAARRPACMHRWPMRGAARRHACTHALLARVHSTEIERLERRGRPAMLTHPKGTCWPLAHCS